MRLKLSWPSATSAPYTTATTPMTTKTSAYWRQVPGSIGIAPRFLLDVIEPAARTLITLVAR